MRLALQPSPPTANIASAARRACLHVAVALHLLVSCPPDAFAIKDTVVRVLEPNVVKLESTGIVTLAGSYTPKRLPSCFTYDPAAALRRTLPPKTAVEIEATPGKGSKTLAWIIRSRDGTLVQSTLVEGGWAQLSKSAAAADDEPRLAALRTQQAAAKAKKLGLWQDCGEAAAAEATRSDRVDFETQFEPLKGSEFEYGRVAPAAVGAVAAATTESLPNPGDTKNCADFEYFEEAKIFFDKYYPLYGDVAKLDSDQDGVPCPGLPHTPRREMYQAKQPRPEFRMPVAVSVPAAAE